MRLPIAFVVVWSTGYVAGPLALRHADPLAMLAIRFGLASVAFALLALACRSRIPATCDEWKHIAVAGLLLQTIQFGAVYAGMSLGVSGGLTALIAGTMPLIVALLSDRFLGERISKSHWAGIALGIVGVSVVVYSRAHVGTTSWLGMGFVALGTVALAAGTLYQRRFAARMDLFAGGAIQTALSAVVLGALAVLTHARVEPDASLAWTLAYMVGVNTLLAASMMVVMLRRGEANRVAAWFFLVPPVSALFSAAILGERFTALTLVGFAVAASGVALTATDRALAAR